MLRDFLKMEASGGLLLIFFAILAMLVANSPLSGWYHHFLHESYLKVQLGPLILDKHIIHWVNDGLMTIFFFLVGLEIKREMLEGALSSPAKAILPGLAAVGGMVVPGTIYYYMNATDPIAIKGWAVPTATDIAFAVGVLSLLGRKVPLALKVFLLALAIFDDLGAIIIIALFYSQSLDMFNLLVGLFFVLGLMGLNRSNVSSGSMYLLLGMGLWWCVLKSGVHATLAGVVVAFCIPLSIPGERRSLLRQLEHDLHPLVALFILPMFAFANAGVNLEGITINALFEPVTVGIIAGLFLGKQLGIFGATWLAVKLRFAPLMHATSWPQVWAVSMIAGIGFTMSIFVATLGFAGDPSIYITEAKLGILIGSAISAVSGLILLWLFSRKNDDMDEAEEDKIACE